MGIELTPMRLFLPILLIWALGRGRTAKFHLGPFELIVIAYVSYLVVRVIFGRPGQEVDAAGDVVVGVLFAWLAGGAFAERDAGSVYLSWSIAATAFLLVSALCYGVAILKGRPLSLGLAQGVGIAWSPGGNFRMTGVDVDPNYFAAGAGVCVLMGLCGLVGKRLSLWSGLLLIGGGAALVLSASRAAIVVCGFLAALALGRSFRKAGAKRVAAVSFGSAVLLVLASGSSELGLMSERFQAVGRDFATGRLEYYKLAWKLFVQHPLFGIGLGRFHQVHAALTGDYHVVHSMPLQVLVETGVTGEALLLGVVVTFGKRIAALKRRAPTSAWPVYEGAAYALASVGLQLLSVSEIVPAFWSGLVLVYALRHTSDAPRVVSRGPVVTHRVTQL
jgi:O-antigen ligase